MDKKLAQTVATHFTFKVMEGLEDYVAMRIAALQTELEQTTDVNRMFKLQGSIYELRGLLKIRDHAMAIVMQG